MKNNTELRSILTSIEKRIANFERSQSVITDWLPKKAVMRFFDYGETQLRVLETTNKIECSVIGRRKFYRMSSIIKLLEKNAK